MRTSKLFQANLIREIILFVILAIVTGTFFSISLWTNLNREFINRGTSIVNSIANSNVELVLNRDASTIQSTIDQFLDPQNGVAYVFVVNEQNTFIAHTFVPAVPTEIIKIATGDANKTLVRNITIPGQGEYLDVTAPILAGVAGFVHVGMDLAIIRASIQSAIINQLLLIGLVLVISVMVAYVQSSRVSQPLIELTAFAQKVINRTGPMEETVALSKQLSSIAQRKDEIGLLTKDFQQMIEEIHTYEKDLENRVHERTRDLELSAEVGRRISEIRDLDILLTQAAENIRHRFNLYHVQIYLADNEQQLLRLQAGTGLAGEEMLNRKHQLPIGLTSINGLAASEKRPVIISDTAVSDTFRSNPLLPETRSEAAIPLLVKEEVVGVLDMQSATPNAFSEDSLPAFEALAGQLAVSIENAALFSQQDKLTRELQENARRIAENTNFLDSVVENLPLMVSVKEAETLRYIRWNRAGANLVGMPAETFIGKTDYDLFPAAEAEAFSANDRAVLKNGLPVDIPEEPISTADKGIRLLHTVKVPILDSEGNPQFLMGISEDITEGKQADLMLRERVKELNLLNELGRVTEAQLPIPDFLRFVTEHIPHGMQYPESCQAAILLQGIVYGAPEAVDLPCQIVEGIRIGNEQVGRIYIAYTEQLSFLNEESALIGDIGRRVSNYIETQWLLERIQNNAGDLQTVAEVSTAVAAILDKQQLLQESANLTQTRFGLYLVQIYLYDPLREELSLAARSGELGPQISDLERHMPLAKSRSPIIQVVRTGQPVLINDVRRESGASIIASLPETRAEVVVPLLIGDQVLGVLDLLSSVENRFTADDITILATLGAQIAVALQNAIQYDETQTALQELNALQQIMAREGWGDFLANARLASGYRANQDALQPLAATLEKEGVELETAVTYPLQVRGVTVGSLGVRPSGNKPLSTENQAFLQAISLQVAEALERARLLEATETARSQTEALFSSSEHLVRATTPSEILQALVQGTELRNLDSASLVFFDKAWQTEMPQSVTISAIWHKDGTPPEIDINTAYPTESYPVLQYLTRERPFVSANITEDPRLDDATRHLFADIRNIKTIIALPLVAGDLWIGFVMGVSKTIQHPSETAIRQILSLTGQSAVVAQTQRLYEEAQQRAQREQLLRKVSDQVYTAIDTETVLRTATREIGRALGLETFVYLKTPANKSAKPAENGGQTS